MKVFDTSQKIYRNFAPAKTVGIYVCGITPYDAAHLGHIFTFMAYDLLQRRLESLGHIVNMVRNITDVDEPIYKKAAQLNIPYTELAAAETASFQNVLKQLDFRPASNEPKASEYIAEMAEAVGQLEGNGYAYRVDNDIYFDVARIPQFGELSGFSPSLQLAFMKRRGGDPDRPGKRSPLDFLLWKSVSDPADPAAWDSPVGRGRPGWHIECSVMSSLILGTPFDLHGGGYDLIFPHHECEIAQAIGLGGSQPASFWMHVAPMQLYGEKMSKSLGNLVFAKDLLASHQSSVLRLALMNYHYQTGGEWQECYLHEARDLLGKFTASLNSANTKYVDELRTALYQALDDNLDTPQVIHAMKHFVTDTPIAPAEAADKLDSPAPASAATIESIYQLLGLHLQ